MTLSAGTRLGPYEILAPIRAGIRRHSERSEESRARLACRLVEYGIPRRVAPRDDKLLHRVAG